MKIKEAQETYRVAWHWRCLARTREQQREAEEIMDSVQADCTIARRPGPEWEAFIDTLPGYREHWADFVSECEATIEKLKNILVDKPPADE